MRLCRLLQRLVNRHGEPRCRKALGSERGVAIQIQILRGTVGSRSPRRKLGISELSTKLSNRATDQRPKMQPSELTPGAGQVSRLESWRSGKSSLLFTRARSFHLPLPPRLESRLSSFSRFKQRGTCGRDAMATTLEHSVSVSASLNLVRRGPKPLSDALSSCITMCAQLDAWARLADPPRHTFLAS